MNSDTQMICKHIECEERVAQGWHYCSFHRDGGVLGNGEMFEQYQIIEQDFIDFIKVVPINEPNHLKVYSPVLRDVIIRCCVGIEIFFKEWSKYICSEDSTDQLSVEYFETNRQGEIKGERRWTFGSYFQSFRDMFSEYDSIYVSPLNQEILPFESWEDKKNPPFWWKAYNSIKHSGASSKYDANLENALYSLSALFLMHCKNNYSRAYLDKYRNCHIRNRIRSVEVEFDSITTPLDSKQFLFKKLESRNQKFVLITEQQFKDRNKRWI